MEKERTGGDETGILCRGKIDAQVLIEIDWTRARNVASPLGGFALLLSVATMSDHDCISTRLSLSVSIGWGQGL
jgi:hypothetical protein